MRIAFTDAIEQRECADEKVVSRRRQPRSQSEQALNSVIARHDLSRSVEHTGQPAFEGRDARAGDARQRRLTPGLFANAEDVARKAFVRRIDGGAPFEGGAGGDQPDRRGADGPGRRTPRFTLIQGQPNGIADR